MHTRTALSMLQLLLADCKNDEFLGTQKHHSLQVNVQRHAVKWSPGIFGNYHQASLLQEGMVEKRVRHMQERVLPRKKGTLLQGEAPGMAAWSQNSNSQISRFSGLM